jgi:hypothetical protein
MSSSDNEAVAALPESPGEGFALTSWDSALKGRRRLFVLYYCTDAECFLKPVEAYQKAYAKRRDGVAEEPSHNTAAVNSWKLQQRPEIKAAIKKLLRSVQEEIDEATKYEVLRMYKTLALYNTADIIDKNGRLKIEGDDLSELGELSKCIVGISKKVSDKGGVNYEVKLADRFKALEGIAKYLELIKPDGDTTVNVPVMVINPKRFDQESEMINVTEKDAEN